MKPKLIFIQVKNRAMLVHSLLSSYKLLNKLVHIPLTKATQEDLLSFHSSDYVKFLRNPSEERSIKIAPILLQSRSLYCKL